MIVFDTSTVVCVPPRGYRDACWERCGTLATMVTERFTEPGQKQ